MHRNRGFTLIELLVVIAIIGLLASVVYTSLQATRVKARDVRRISDIKQISTAVELYNNNVGHYPVSTSWVSECQTAGANWIGDNGTYSWSAPYVPTMPRDPSEKCVSPYTPLETSQSQAYVYWSDGNIFALGTKLENTFDAPTGMGVAQYIYFNGSNFAATTTAGSGGSGGGSQSQQSPYTIAIASTNGSPTAFAPIQMSATFWANVKSPGLAQSSVHVTNGTVDNFYQSNSTTYYFQINPTSEGTIQVTIPANSAQDTGGNANVDSSASITYDTTPRPVLSPDPLPSPEHGGFTVTANFGEQVNGFTSSDVAVTNASVGSISFHITNNGQTTIYYYQFTVTPSQAGAVTVQIPAGVVTSQSGKSNTASNILSTTYAP